GRERRLRAGDVQGRRGRPRGRRLQAVRPDRVRLLLGGLVQLRRRRRREGDQPDRVVLNASGTSTSITCSPRMVTPLPSGSGGNFRSIAADSTQRPTAPPSAWVVAVEMSPFARIRSPSVSFTVSFGSSASAFW